MEVGLLVAFFSGLVSFFAPCVIPLVPAYVGYVTGVSYRDLSNKKTLVHYRRKVLISSVFYVLGFSLVFTLLGSAAASLGMVFHAYTAQMQMFGGLAIMFFALSFLGVIKLGVLAKGRRVELPQWVEKLGYGRAFLIGVVFATAWTPCVGAVLGAIMTLAAASQTVWSGAGLLFVYSLGISLPFLIISLGIAQAPMVLKQLGPHLDVVGKIAGVMLLVIGFLLFNNHLKLVSDSLTYDWLNGKLFELGVGWEYRLR